MDETYTIRGTAVVVSNCIRCGVVFTVPKVVWDEQRRDSGHHYCPNGHQQGWSKQDSETERLRRERDKLQQQMARVEDEKRAALAEAEKSAKALTRHKKRAAAGTCPCCKRTFTNMALHIKHKHPDFAKPNVVVLKGGAA